MNKIKSDRINFNDDDFLIKFEKNHPVDDGNHKQNVTSDEFKNNEINEVIEAEISETTKEEQEAQINAQEIISKANSQAEEIIKKAHQEAKEILKNTNKEAQNILENSKKEAQEILTSSQEELEKIKIEATKQGYEEGHKDGLEKIQEELEEKIEAFSNFCKSNIEIKEKILKSASRDILDIIINISNKILLKNIDSESIEKIINATIQKLEKKENITITVSEKYARLLFELQNKKLEDDSNITDNSDSKNTNSISDNDNTDDNKFNFENFKQYDGFTLIHNPKYEDDTIIVENLKERFDSSINSQLEAVIREIFEKTKNAQFDLTDYIDSNIQNETQQEQKQPPEEN